MHLHTKTARYMLMAKLKTTKRGHVTHLVTRFQYLMVGSVNAESRAMKFHDTQWIKKKVQKLHNRYYQAHKNAKQVDLYSIQCCIACIGTTESWVKRLGLYSGYLMTWLSLEQLSLTTIQWVACVERSSESTLQLKSLCTTVPSLTLSLTPHRNSILKWAYFKGKHFDWQL